MTENPTLSSQTRSGAKIEFPAALVHNRMQQDALSGPLFCFFIKARDKVKALHWDTSGFCLYLKRLEKGRF